MKRRPKGTDFVTHISHQSSNKESKNEVMKERMNDIITIIVIIVDRIEGLV